MPADLTHCRLHPPLPSPPQAFTNSKAAIESQVSLPDVRRLFKAAEVLGISHYAPMPQHMTQDSFEVRFGLTVGLS
jgi:hypothetical protein